MKQIFQKEKNWYSFAVFGHRAKARKQMALGFLSLILLYAVASLLSGLLAPAGVAVASAIAGGIAVDNRGRIIDTVAGINGVSAGGTAIVNLDVNRRYHRLSFFATDSAAAAAVGTVITGIKILVNGISIRDISPANMIKIAQANGYYPILGELPIFFTEPGTMNGPNVLEPSDVLSWDMFGQTSFSIQLSIASATVPGVTGLMEYDYQRNVRPGASGLEPFLHPVAQHLFTAPLSSGTTIINNLPISFPIRRIWFQGSSAGNLTSLLIKQDGNVVMNATNAQLKRLYAQYGFKFANYFDYTILQNATGPANLSIAAGVETPAYFDGAAIFDTDGRWWKALKIGQSLEIQVVSGAAQTLSMYMETLPGNYAS